RDLAVALVRELARLAPRGLSIAEEDQAVLPADAHGGGPRLGEGRRQAGDDPAHHRQDAIGVAELYVDLVADVEEVGVAVLEPEPRRVPVVHGEREARERVE